MQITTEVNPDIARYILTDALQKGVSADRYLQEIIEEDKRLELMAEAMHDELFLADLAEIAEDFKHIDRE